MQTPAPTLESTLDFIKQAHKDQQWGDIPYWQHPYNVMKRLKSQTKDIKNIPNFALFAALLHDVIEDTDYTPEDLRTMGYPQETLDILSLVTNEELSPEGLSHQDFLNWYNSKIQKIIDSGNEWAIRVKFADMTENFGSIETLNNPKRAEKLREKYTKPYQMLRTAVESYNHPDLTKSPTKEDVKNRN